MRAVADSQVFSNITANTAGFVLQGGVYGVSALAGTWSSGSVALQRLGADGSTYVAVASATDISGSGISFSANGYVGGVALAYGTYRFAVATATGVYAEVIRVPGE